MHMPVIVDGEEYLSTSEACDYLGGISSETLRKRARANGVTRFRRGIEKTVYYKKADLDSKLRAMRPIREGEEDDQEE